MNDQSRTTEQPEQAPQAVASASSGSILQRRRLLQSLGAGGAILGVGLPVSAQTAGRPYVVKLSDSKNYHATASAVGSLIGSIATGGTACSGYSPGYYQNKPINWSGVSFTNGTTAMTYDACGNTGTVAVTKMRFFEAFRLASNPGGNAGLTCAELLGGTSDEAYWLAALLNATKCKTAYPYAPAGILDLYRGVNPMFGGSADPLLKAKAVTLFKDYLSQKV